jgi:type II secretory ATPase GspE/PulE/Tfp pilus assembly ATPase PilB-like protein
MDLDGSALIAAGLIDDAGLKSAREHQRNRGLTLAQSLVALGLLDETHAARALAKQCGMPFVDLSRGRIPEALLARVPAELARAQSILPVAERGGRLVVAIAALEQRLLVEGLAFELGAEVACALAAPGALREAIERSYGPGGFGGRGDGGEAAVAAAARASAGDPDEAPIIRLVARTLQDALDQRASDIHFEPQAARLRVRYRVDGMLRDAAEHPAHLAAPVISRLKIMGSMDIAEKRKPQDGRIELDLGGRKVDVRAAILPSNHGETVVLRLLDRSKNLLTLADLGMNAESLAWFQGVIAKPHGIVLVTGPTGSGKTTTLYAALAALNRPDVKILTAEDPVEYHIPGINQVQVHARIGLTFARILRAMLRCAPNVILVGEIRDLETAETAIQAALTGHLVFSTLHTNDAPSAITRLADMGVAPFLVSSALQAVVAQRLVRRLCRECAEPYVPGSAELAALGLDPGRHAGARLERARGCRACEGSGYRGRVGLYETLELDAELRERVYSRAPLEELAAEARARGLLVPLARDGAQKVLAGLTSAAELMRVVKLAESAATAAAGARAAD